MFQFNNTTDISVVLEGDSGRPREIRSQGERLTVTELESIRDETAAYPLERGPRTVFVVRVRERRYRLEHLLREQRWTLEELGTRTSGLARAA